MIDEIIRWHYCKKHNKDYLGNCSECELEKKMKDNGIQKSIRKGIATQFDCGCIHIRFEKEVEIFKEENQNSRIYFYPCNKKHN